MYGTQDVDVHVQNQHIEMQQHRKPLFLFFCMLTSAAGCGAVLPDGRHVRSGVTVVSVAAVSRPVATPIA